jgi:hypothetical protein
MTESYTHADLKADLYWSIIEDEEYAEVEKGVGRTRTDILTEINNHTVAIEIQHTRIPIKSILKRMREHTEIGAHTLWLITPEALHLEEDRCRHLNWVMFIQRLQGGLIFMPSSYQTIIPARVDNQLRFYKNEIVAGNRKLLNQHSAISLDELKFEKNEQFGLNVVTYDEWWIEEYVDLG